MNKSRIVTGCNTEAKRVCAKELRRQMTPAEAVLWQRLKANRLKGLHFRRQQLIDGFIVDFYCHAACLVIELDGSVHHNQAEYDSLRDHIIATRGLRVLRFPNDRIENEMETVLSEILAAAHECLSPHTPQSQP